MKPPAGIYREFAPPPALRRYVRALFSFRVGATDAAAPLRRPLLREVRFSDGDPAWSSLFASGECSLVVNWGDGYRIQGLWEPRHARPHAIGPMSRARVSSYGESLIQAGAYLRAGAARAVLGVSATELADRVVALDDFRFPLYMEQAPSEAKALQLLEQAIAMRLNHAEPPPLAHAIAAHLDAVHGQAQLQDLARRYGYSRQYLARQFREAVGLSPKLYARLARFRHLLQSAGHDWARAAAEAGYADQSHMIAEFREFSGMTPKSFVRGRHFHPFQQGG